MLQVEVLDIERGIGEDTTLQLETFLMLRVFSKIENFYSFRNRLEIFEFLRNHLFLIPLLQEAPNQITKYFGTSLQLILEVITDPEATEDHELILFIHTDLSPDEALDKLEQLDENWWLDASVNADGKLCVHVEFE